MRQIFLDTETTGLSVEGGDRIVEIGCIEMVNRRLTDNNLHHYLNPQRSSHPDAARVHGLTDIFLADKPLFEHIADDLLAYLSGAEIIIHNAAFDTAFLNAELSRLGRGAVHHHVHKVTCSLLMARETYPGKANSLDALCRRLEVDNSNRTLHGALLDAGLLAEVYIRLTRGQNALVIDIGDEGPEHITLGTADLAGFTLPVLYASDDEASAHAALIAELDKVCGGRALWRAALLEPESAMA